jgi:hypothetical protein
VVAERDHVGPRGEDPIREPRREATAVGGVLGVHDAEVGAELVAEPCEALLDGAAPRGAEDVRDEEQLQGSVSVGAA